MSAPTPETVLADWRSHARIDPKALRKYLKVRDSRQREVADTVSAPEGDE